MLGIWFRPIPTISCRLLKKIWFRCVLCGMNAAELPTWAFLQVLTDAHVVSLKLKVDNAIDKVHNATEERSTKERRGRPTQVPEVVVTKSCNRLHRF